MEIKDLKKHFDKDYTANQVTREKASDDLVFYWVTQWDDELLSSVPLQYRGQFDVLRKAGRQILSDLRQNPIQPEFRPKDATREDDADIIDGLYRACDRQLASQEAYDMAAQDAVVCGYGAWELYTEYESSRTGDEKQVIRRQWIPEANNTVFWDANAKKLDKSDAKRCTILKAMTHDGYKDFIEELTGERPESIPSNFASPEDSFTFQWQGAKDTIYVATVYVREKVKDRVLTLADPFGDTQMLLESQLVDVMDDLIDQGHMIVSEKEIERWQVTRYIADGSDIVDEAVIAGEHIPVIPAYGERTIVEDTEHWEGITRLAKDPQRLRNFQMSYLADIVSRSPRPKPIFTADQLSGYEFMYEESGPDNNYPYLLQNSKDKQGQPLPIGPVAQMPEQPMPNALAASIQLSREAVEDVANPGMPQDVGDPDLSGKAIHALQSRMDQQSYVYQHHLKFAKRRDAEVWASMATVIYDTPRTISIETEDGNSKQVQLMSVVMDGETGEPVVLNDLTNMEFEVYAEIGHSYQSQKEQTKDRLAQMLPALMEGDPAKDVIMLSLLTLEDGIATKPIRDFARKNLVLKGYVEPETEEEVAMMQQQAQQAEKPDANTLLAQAEMLKGQAAMMRERRQAKDDAVDAHIDEYNAVTKRMDTQIKAQEVGANVSLKSSEKLNKDLDAVQKQQEIAEKEMLNRIGSMPTADLLGMLQ